MNKIGIIIQAGTGSGRLPKKVLLPFVIATTKNDGVIVKTAQNYLFKNAGVFYSLLKRILQ